MNNDTDETVNLLRSIDNSLKEILKLSKARAGKAGKPVADDADLDSKWGDPVVKLAPRDWAGEDCKGRRFSECPPEFLDKLAEMYAYFGDKNEKSGATLDNGKPKALYDRQAESRCRGWAKRKRAGWTPPAPSASFGREQPANGFGADPYAKSASPFGESKGFGESYFEEDQEV